ncbi:MAG: oligosaccharide flippase family protein [Rhodobacteraceae bacterium]|nr:oligosaccharide flippase family protein [Paracoccaceae bacterium]
MAAARFEIARNVRAAVLGFAVNLATVVVSYRLVIMGDGLEALGLWSLLMAWIGFARLGDPGLPAALLRHVASEGAGQEALRRDVQTGLIAHAALGALAGLAGFLLLRFALPALVPDAHLHSAQGLLPALAFLFFLTAQGAAPLAVLRGLHLGHLAARLSIVGNGVQLTLVLWLVPGHGLTGLALAQIAQAGLVCALGWIALRRRLSIVAWLPLEFRRDSLSALMGVGLRLQAVSLAAGLFEPVSKLLVGHAGGLAAQGLYELAYKTVTLPRVMTSAGLAATIPAMAALAGQRDALRNLFGTTERRMIYATAAALGLAAAGAPVLSLLWLGQVDAGYLLQVGVLALGGLGAAVGAAGFCLGQALGRLGPNMVTSLAALAVLVVLGGPLGEWLGAFGAVLATALAQGGGGLAQRWGNRRLLGTTPVGVAA